MMKALLRKSFKVVINADWNQFCSNREYFISDLQKKANISLILSKFLLLTFQVPLPVEKINSTEHPVKVGLSDAFMALLSSLQSPGQYSIKGTIPNLKCTIYYFYLDYYNLIIGWTVLYCLNGYIYTVNPLTNNLSAFNQQMLEEGLSMNTIGWKSTQQRLSIAQLSSSALYPVSKPMAGCVSLTNCSSRNLIFMNLTTYRWRFAPLDVISCFMLAYLSLACLQHTTCEHCLQSNLTSGCGWCNTLQRWANWVSALQNISIIGQLSLSDSCLNACVCVQSLRCSDGIDRYRQEWLDYSCSEEVWRINHQISANKLLLSKIK